MGLFGKKKPSPAKMEAVGIAAFEAEEYDDAIKIFANLCDIEPTSERLYYLGVLMDMWGEPDAATSALTQAVQMDPGNFQALYSLAIVRMGQKTFRERFRQSVEPTRLRRMTSAS